MDELLNVWIINRRSNVLFSGVVLSYDINRDYLTSEKSSFTLAVGESEKLIGCFLLAKFLHGKGTAFFGVIDSFENSNVVCNDIFSLVNFEFPATRFTGNSFETHARNLIHRYLVQDEGKDIAILDMAILSNTPHTYQPSEPPTPTNLMKYLINAFKKYNIVWEFDRFENGRIKTTLRKIESSVKLKNNIYEFANWDVSFTQVGKGVENHLFIVDKITSNSEMPVVLSEWWLTTENEVTQNKRDIKITIPTKTKVWIYDNTEEDKPTYQSIAESELSGGFYSHEIYFEMKKQNNLFKFEDLKIGLLATIHYDNQVYQSVLTGYRLTNDSEFVELRFGHIRSRLSELLD